MKPAFTVERFDGSNPHEVWAHCSAIARTMVYPSFFCSGDWLKVAAENLCPGDEAYILLAKDADDIRGVLPLVRKRNALGGTDLHYLGSDFYPDPLGLICSPADRADCAAALRNHLLNAPDWDRLILDFLLEDEPADWTLPGKPVSVAPFKVLPRDFSELLGEFKKKKRYNLRAMVKKLLDAGGELAAPSGPESNIAYLDALFFLHEKRASERSLDSSFTGPRVQSLHRALVAASDNVRFFGLRFNGRMIAVIYGFEFCNRFFYYQVAHDPDHGHLSPGTVLLYLVIEACCGNGLTEFNFLQGDETYKGIWTNDSRILYRCVLNRSTWRSRVFSAVEESRGYVKRAMGLMSRGN